MFAGVAGAALLNTLAPLLKVFFDAIGKDFNDWLAAKRSEQANQYLGASRVTATVNKDASDAESRANQVAVNQPDVDDALDRYSRGEKF